MKVARIIVILLPIALSAHAQRSKAKVVKGDMYFAIIDFVRWFDSPDSTLHRLEKVYNDTTKIDSLFHELKQNGLLKKPFIRIINNHDSIKTVFISDEDYEKIKRFDCWELIDEGRKVEVTVKVKRLELKPYPLIIATEPLTFKVVQGKTRHN